ncbi:SGNH/GDSL hydrolase family protein [Chryseobacterium sp. ZHDP1]|uniref:SGNH/GDSL hydrolase family protein n=1 Tax=Chryseobacterium sp. ZHDP1 TaxID=2838877 RepID=UPI001BE03D95|nr:SGNH/GDSL hydrolase family protein [Chryseobacterium sp. ZHDP1]QWA38878.1 SGNH/GDSL hydrolase family protein [Chryseobacterium sp. ZHDP1]
MEIGIIKNYSSFSNLSETDISAGWSIINNKLVSPADITKPLQFKYVSGLWQWKRTIVSNKKSLKLFINNTAGNYTGEFYINTQNKLCSSFSYDSSLRVSTDAISYNAGDLLEFSILKNAWSTFFAVKNLSTNQTVTLDASNVVFAIHKLKLITSEVTEISSYKFESSQPVGGTYVVGDSITNGSAATTPELSWVGLTGWNRLCGPGDRSADAILLLEEILNYVKPDRIVYAMGTNDPNIDVWKNAVQQFKQVLNAGRITFIPICPYANGVKSMEAFQQYIVGNFSIYFDFYSVTKAQGSTILNPLYDSGDHVHPNNPGHSAIGNYTINSPHYNYFKNFADDTLQMYAFYRQML